MKICSKCLRRKAEDNFYYRSRAKNQLHSECKDCYKQHRKQYSAMHYQKYGDAYRERAKLRSARIKRGLQLELIKYMQDKACLHCDESDIRVLEFDHIDPKTKSFSIAQGITNGLTWIEIYDEITKCQILCSNCHKKRTATQNGWFKAIGMQ